MKRICFQSWAIEESSSDHCVSRAGLAAETSKEAEKGIALLLSLYIKRVIHVRIP